jgi:hypothetical protein
VTGGILFTELQPDQATTLEPGTSKGVHRISVLLFVAGACFLALGLPFAVGEYQNEVWCYDSNSSCPAYSQFVWEGITISIIGVFLLFVSLFGWVRLLQKIPGYLKD